MSTTRVPVTDAFDDTDPMESLNVDLTAKQIAWLKETAADRGLSFDHMLRTLINAHIRKTEHEAEAPAHSGDGTPLDDAPDAPTASDNDADDASSLADRLRTTSERVEAPADSSNPDPAPEPAMSDSGTSMFDMMDE